MLCASSRRPASTQAVKCNHQLTSPLTHPHFSRPAALSASPKPSSQPSIHLHTYSLLAHPHPTSLAPRPVTSVTSAIASDSHSQHPNQRLTQHIILHFLSARPRLQYDITLVLHNLLERAVGEFDRRVARTSVGEDVDLRLKVGEVDGLERWGH